MIAEREDARDIVEREAEAHSKEQFLKALGPLTQYFVPRAPGEPAVFNVNVNGGDRGKILVETANGKVKSANTMARDARQYLISNIATKSGTSINQHWSRLDADMPHGFDIRVKAFCPPAGDWTLSCRVNAEFIIPLDKYIEIGWLTQTRRAAIRAVIERGGNIGVVGRRGSGKTTFLNALLHEAADAKPMARLVVIQDVNEVKASHDDHITIRAGIEQRRYQGREVFRGDYAFNDALTDALRTDYDMIAVNEMRSGKAARTLLDALNTGGGGCFATWHANSAVDGLYRLEDLLRWNGEVPPRRMIARFLDLIVVMGMDDNRKRSVLDVAPIDDIPDDAPEEYQVRSIA
jgi:Flp pilus assembly CpaF family ATPase